jgi:hypothetical protein
MTHDIIQPNYPRTNHLKLRLEAVGDLKAQVRMAVDECQVLEDELECANARLADNNKAIAQLRSAEAALYELARVVGSRHGTPHEV